MIPAPQTVTPVDDLPEIPDTPWTALARKLLLIAWEVEALGPVTACPDEYFTLMQAANAVGVAAEKLDTTFVPRLAYWHAAGIDHIPNRGYGLGRLATR